MAKSPQRKPNRAHPGTNTVLALFFTRNVSLQTWLDSGLFDREKLLYEGLLRRGALTSVLWLTYGSGDGALADDLIRKGRLHPGITVCPMPRAFAAGKWLTLWYSLALPWLWREVLQDATVLKTNQMDGAWSAVIARWIHDKPLLLRTGYTLSQLTARDPSAGFFKRRWTRWIEKLAYRYCDFASVSSRHNLRYLGQRYALTPERCAVVGNGVDIHRFLPHQGLRASDRLLFVGRLHPEKNLPALIEACGAVGKGLDIVGTGPLEQELRALAIRRAANVRFLGALANSELPAIYNRYRYYVLPSYHEGMPKTLIEAMACGCLCIGTDVEGINEVIQDEVNGVLANDTSASAVAAAIRRAERMDFPALSRQARDTIRDQYSFEALIAKEAAILQQLTVPATGPSQ